MNTSNQRIYHDIATNISGLIILLLLTYVLIQQFLSEICKQFWKKVKQRVVRNKNKIDREVDSHIKELNTTASGSDLAEDPQKPTSSITEGFTKCHESNKIIIASDYAVNVELRDDDDATFIISGDSTASLLRKEISRNIDTLTLILLTDKLNQRCTLSLFRHFSTQTARYYNYCSDI